MAPKERVQKAIQRKKVELDRLPHQIDFTWKMKQKVSKASGLKEQELPFALKNHIFYIDTHQKVRKDETKGVDYDIFGVGWDIVRSEGYLPIEHPLDSWEKVKTYQFPDPKSPVLYRDAQNIERAKEEGMFILGCQGWALFERAWLLRGFENFMMDLADNLDRAEKLLDEITEYQIEVSKNLIKLGVDGIYTGDDYGSQRGLLISKKTWQKLIKPRLAKVWKVAKNEGLPVFHHSCGNVVDILDDMIEIGLNVLLPVQPQAMDIKLLQERFGDRLSFMGGVSTQQTLPFGSPGEVKEEVKNCIEILGERGGYIIAASHEITSDCSIENLRAFLETIRDVNGSEIPLLESLKP
ncbi:MAG: hypothetical protein PWP60_793 [Candidatus Atribacteria bacterium]|jgi:uroporphyrinogen decarboxylase|uniref:Uroporphyrinogen decarboxylase family protein n=1 Tax=Thermatribacter velox TaxID=3039681 RepID=A0ABZ2YDA3_9BACT|nr:hypothetical protein [Candidatus Atribacteria bacterium]MDI3530944.1 hypothetical protein [Candidatus Atribacteria bacterium]